MKKVLSIILFISLTLTSLGVKVKAASNSNTGVHVIGNLSDDEERINPYITYKTVKSLDSSSNSMLRNVPNGTYLFSILNLWCTRVTDVYENGYSKPKKFIQFVSSAWAKRSQYTETETNTVSWSKSSNITADIADGVKVQFGRSYTVTGSLGIGSVIPCDPTKYSKLALYATFYDYYLKCIESNTSYTKTYSTYYGDVLFPTGDLYYEVVYQ